MITTAVFRNMFEKSGESITQSNAKMIKLKIAVG
jgi:hypothetical protein